MSCHVSRRIAQLLLFLNLTLWHVKAQTNPNATSLAISSVRAMTNGVHISDATLQATVTRTLGSETTSGPATLVALATHASRVNMTLEGSTSSETRSIIGIVPSGRYKNSKGESKKHASHNLWSDPVWFFPPLSMLASVSEPTVEFQFIGTEELNGQTVHHIRVQRRINAPDRIVASVLKLSAMDYYLDASSYLPVQSVYQSHPEHSTATNIQHTVKFSSYESREGISYPAVIEEYINGSLVLRIEVTSISLNHHLSSSDVTNQE